ncbi:Recombination protein recR [Oleidesulfovibrio alaskensis G20]|uniref:Recombination protein RecR n=1 Tax=Oleidesulfovibrio alaskensis (strain ATCC BAA-1058 / DSM 17464 / G20) TaxID=207559 RepID=Q30UQ2_OLEA2|nr:recombination mediator RecR [Oleidesulfovibrio alaskensis]ABB36869.2 Recombination protein recR [Oleidesulfovibrio alaskensis G20]MBG0774332.1 recombination protein RecR [Oleidesulfovibrio alaskensis]MBL3583505.1 recombination protein RecR [Oleidesulfovibrio alaskensis]
MTAQRLPEPLKALVDRLARLPGLGPKSALRMAMTLLKWPESETRGLGAAIAQLRDNLHLCRRCGSLTDVDPCAICTDATRGRDTLCLVSEWDSLLAMEDGGFYKGQYMILGGLLAPLDNVNPESLELERLRRRLAEGEVREIILGLGTTLEAENTASYIRSMVNRDFPQVRVTRLAQGIPLGSEVKFIDKETLRQSLQFRQDL